MAEDDISPDQHRADLTELRGELKEEIAGVRQDIVRLTKKVESNQQLMLLRFEHMDRQMAADREAMLLRFEQIDQRFKQQFQHFSQQFQQVDQQFSRHNARLLSLENWMRTTYVTLAVVVVGVAAQLFYTLLRFGLKPPTP